MSWGASSHCRGAHLLVAAGSTVYVHSLATAQRVRSIACAPGSVDVSARLCIEGRRDSRLLFTGVLTVARQEACLLSCCSLVTSGRALDNCLSSGSAGWLMCQAVSSNRFSNWRGQCI